MGGPATCSLQSARESSEQQVEHDANRPVGHGLCHGLGNVEPSTPGVETHSIRTRAKETPRTTGLRS